MGVKSGDKVILIKRRAASMDPAHLSPQVLLPEYGGMQVKIDDKELFMFRCEIASVALNRMPVCCLLPPLPHAPLCS
jgi:hypothetical protein